MRPPIFRRAPTPITPGAPVAEGSRGWKLWDQNTAPSAIVDAINGAQRVVNAEFFGITDAGKGAHVVDALVNAARRGVEVNVIADLSSAVALPVGSFLRLRNRVTEAGGRVITSNINPVDVGEQRAAGRKHVDHRKVVTVDGRVAFTGGMNFLPMTDDYHDSVVQLGGVAAARLGADQLDRWHRVGGGTSAAHVQSVRDALAGASIRPTDPHDMAVVVNAPEQRKFDLTNEYVRLIREAKHRVWISSPTYTDQVLLKEIRAAAERGVDVRLVSPGSNLLGMGILNEVARSNLAKVMAAGGKAFEIPEVLHRKAIIADDTVILGSYNITRRSRSEDHELGVATKDPEFVAAVESVLAKDIARSKLLDPGARSGPFRKVSDWLSDLGFSY